MAQHLFQAAQTHFPNRSWFDRYASVGEMSVMTTRARSLRAVVAEVSCK